MLSRQLPHRPGHGEGALAGEKQGEPGEHGVALVGEKRTGGCTHGELIAVAVRRVSMSRFCFVPKAGFRTGDREDDSPDAACPAHACEIPQNPAASWGG